MNEFVAIVRVRPPAGAGGGSGGAEGGAEAEGSLPSLASAIRACRARVVGLLEATADGAGPALEFRFDRARSSVADIVRCLEDHGFTVTAVAQTRAAAPVQAATA